MYVPNLGDPGRIRGLAFAVKQTGSAACAVAPDVTRWKRTTTFEGPVAREITEILGVIQADVAEAGRSLQHLADTLLSTAAHVEREYARIRAEIEAEIRRQQAAG